MLASLTRCRADLVSCSTLFSITWIAFRWARCLAPSSSLCCFNEACFFFPFQIFKQKYVINTKKWNEKLARNLSFCYCYSYSHCVCQVSGDGSSRRSFLNDVSPAFGWHALWLCSARSNYSRSKRTAIWCIIAVFLKECADKTKKNVEGQN